MSGRETVHCLVLPGQVTGTRSTRRPYLKKSRSTACDQRWSEASLERSLTPIGALASELVLASSNPKTNPFGGPNLNLFFYRMGQLLGGSLLELAACPCPTSRIFYQRALIPASCSRPLPNRSGAPFSSLWSKYSLPRNRTASFRNQLEGRSNKPYDRLLAGLTIDSPRHPIHELCEPHL